jgi:hypothetical protein
VAHLAGQAAGPVPLDAGRALALAPVWAVALLAVLVRLRLSSAPARPPSSRTRRG